MTPSLPLFRNALGRCSSVALLFGTLLALFGCTALPTGLTAVQPFDISRYQGEWFEIARLDHRFERGLSDVSAVYTIRQDGSVSVLNKGFDTARCRWRSIEGSARFIADRSTGSLAVSFFGPFAGGYHVIELDRVDYRWAMVSGPTRGYLWILARDRALDTETWTRLTARARELEFPTESLIRVEHGRAEQPC